MSAIKAKLVHGAHNIRRDLGHTLIDTVVLLDIAHISSAVLTIGAVAVFVFIVAQRFVGGD